MRSSIRKLVFGLLAIAWTTVPASAQLSSGPLPGGAYITFGGLEWAWAFPLAAPSGSFTFAGQSGYGWRLPTGAELLGAPSATAFLFSGGNVPFEGTDPSSGATFQYTNSAYTSAESAGACATPWFSTFYYHCDWGNGGGQTDVNTPGGIGIWAGLDGSTDFSEQLVVRDASQVVPEPTTMSLMALGLVGLMGAGRRRRRS